MRHNGFGNENICLFLYCQFCLSFQLGWLNIVLIIPFKNILCFWPILKNIPPNNGIDKITSPIGEVESLCSLKKSD
jgi:hypothetical protein